MPFETKMNLANALNRLNLDEGRVVSIVRKAQPGFAKGHQGSEEVELDINALDHSTLWKLHTGSDQVENKTQKEGHKQCYIEYAGRNTVC